MSNVVKTQKVNFVDIDKIRHVSDENEILESYIDYLSDESKSVKGKAKALFFPANESEVASILAHANEQKIPVQISGARTGLTGGAVPEDAYLISMEKMNALKGIGFDSDAGRYYFVFEAGIPLADVYRIVENKEIDSLKGKSPEMDKVIEKYMADKKHFFPPDPTESTAQLGGATATNASGAMSFKYGAMREWIKGLRVVLPNGEVLDINRGDITAENGLFKIVYSNGEEVKVKVPDYKMPETKNSAGLYAKPDMDLVDLFIGSEGILGVITEVRIWVTEKPETTMTLMIYVPKLESALDLVDTLRDKSSGLNPTLVEFMDKHAVNILREAKKSGTSSVQIPDIPEDTEAIIYTQFPFKEEEMDDFYMALMTALEKHGIDMEQSWAAMDISEFKKMKAVRHLVPEHINNTIARIKQKYPEIHKVGTDMAVPNEHLRTFINYYIENLESSGLEYVMFGHIGSNHLHVNIIPKNPEEQDRAWELYMKFIKKAVELGGTVSAEHGIGKLKKEFLKVMYGDKIHQIAEVKRVFDPNWILNPDVMIEVPS